MTNLSETTSLSATAGASGARQIHREAPAVPAKDRVMVVTVAVCTFRRPAITECLQSLAAQQLHDVRQSVLVIDNDDQDTARTAIEDAGRDLNLDLRYVHAPGRNISIARNACIEACDTHWLVFIDDDEIAAPDWLQGMVDRMNQTPSAAIFGPMQAIYDKTAPGWLKRGDFHSVSVVYVDGEIRTGYAGNSLIDLQHPAVRSERFDLAFGKSGGEDTDFFDRIYRNGGRFDYAATALVTERLAVDRQNLAWFLRRRYRSGQTHGRTLARRNQGRDRLPQIAKAAIKAGTCFAMTVVTLPAPVAWRRWLLRGALHAGVVARLFGQREAAFYGQQEAATS
ncbi:MAG TPA: glycosyltransferase family 2 protein [Dongiaceae bacterium]|nr:glycosyltransferase family 2 protein [Dongiaceae bacterium]